MRLAIASSAVAFPRRRRSVTTSRSTWSSPRSSIPSRFRGLDHVVQRDDRCAGELRDVPGPPEDADRLAGRSLRAAGDFARRLRADRGSDPARRLLHHPASSAFSVGLEPLEETETGAQGGESCPRQVVAPTA
jgi:hypothetical protein